MPICRILLVFCFSLLISSCDQKIPLKSIAIVSVTTDTRTPFPEFSNTTHNIPGPLHVKKNGPIDAPKPAYSLTENEQTFLFKQAHSLLKNIKNMFEDKIEIITNLPQPVIPEELLADETFEFEYIIPPFQRIDINKERNIAIDLCKSLRKDAVATLSFNFKKKPNIYNLSLTQLTSLITYSDINLMAHATIVIVDHNGKLILKRTFYIESEILIKHESEGSFTLTEQNRKAYEDAVTKLEAHVLEEIGKIIQ